MKANDLLDLIGDVDERLIAEAKTEQKHSGWVRWGAIAACCCLLVGSVTIGQRFLSQPEMGSGTPVAGGAVSMMPEPDRPALETQENTGDLAPMIYVDSTLYIISERQEIYSETDERLLFLGAIISRVDSSIQPKEEFQSNDDIIGATVYQREEKLIVFFNDQCWVYRPYRDD